MTGGCGPVLGGTGTLPFLIGMAWFEDESLRIEQLLLQRPGEEAPIPAELREQAANLLPPSNMRPRVVLRFAAAQVEYQSEGIPWSHIDFKDNAAVSEQQEQEQQQQQQ